MELRGRKKKKKKASLKSGGPSKVHPSFSNSLLPFFLSLSLLFFTY
jgi:hypothetical protein